MTRSRSQCCSSCVVTGSCGLRFHYCGSNGRKYSSVPDIKVSEQCDAHYGVRNSVVRDESFHAVPSSLTAQNCCEYTIFSFYFILHEGSAGAYAWVHIHVMLNLGTDGTHNKWDSVTLKASQTWRIVTLVWLIQFYMPWYLQQSLVMENSKTITPYLQE